MSSTTSAVSQIYQLVDDASKAISRLNEGNLANSAFLFPWRWLYFTKVTGKRFVFPTFTPSDLLNTNNKWGEVKNPFHEITDKLENWAYNIRVFADITDLIPKPDGTSRYSGYKVEYPKGYAYDPENTPKLQSNFVLFNTIEKDAWKKNYRFLIMFILRNMAFRTSISSYQPSLLYDIIVPGVKHLPLCYVEQIDITPEGHVRTMPGENILKDVIGKVTNEKVQIPVPEAWRISIQFRCLIPDTANLLLDTLTLPINIKQKQVDAESEAMPVDDNYRNQQNVQSNPDADQLPASYDRGINPSITDTDNGGVLA